MSEKKKSRQSKFISRLDEIYVFSSPEEAAEFRRKRKAEIKAGIEAMRREAAERRAQQAKEKAEQSSEEDSTEESTEEAPQAQAIRLKKERSTLKVLKYKSLCLFQPLQWAYLGN
jgi:hypothetical protein